MTVALGPGYLALALCLFVPLAARADAVHGACLGTWRFELARPDAEKESWLSPDSWCRAKNLPQHFVVEIRRGDDGRVAMTGEPLRPVDVMVGASQCEFQFSSETGGLPRHHELTIAVNEAGRVVRGTAHCSERTPKTNGNSTGISIDLAVTGSRSGEGQVKGQAKVQAAGPDQMVAEVVAACGRRDADALWKTMTPRFRSEVDRRAARVRRSVGDSELRALYGHRGRPQTFTGLALLRHAVRTGARSDNPCFGAEAWEVGPATASGRGWLVAVRREEGVAFGLWFTRKAGVWQLDQISKAMPTGNLSTPAQ